MKTLRIGFDVDGILADFNAAFIQRVISITGKDLFPPRPFDIPLWDYPQHYGYTEEECSKTWDDITADPNFWRNLPSYPGTREVISVLRDFQVEGHEVYFITSRPGVFAKQQTEDWLRSYGFSFPTVLICSKKGAAAEALKLTHYIDDRFENVIDVLQRNPSTTTYLLNRPWNTERSSVLPYVRVAYPLEMLTHLSPTKPLV